MDVSETLAPKSQQLDNIDLTHGPRTFTVERVERRDSVDQPLWIYLVEFDRPWPPNVNMRRVIAHVWGKESDVWIGRRLTLFRDPRIKFGSDTTGGTRISHMSHLERKAEIPVLASKGRPASYTVEPLVEELVSEDWPARIATCTDRDELAQWWQVADPRHRKLIEARATELKAADQNEKDWQDVDAAKADDESPETNFDDEAKA